MPVVLYSGGGIRPPTHRVGALLAGYLFVQLARHGQGGFVVLGCPSAPPDPAQTALFARVFVIIYCMRPQSTAPGVCVTTRWLCE